MDEIVLTLKDRYSVHHSTLQIELGTTDHACSLIVTKPVQHHHH
jgi:cobalt-zinc-cadmium efflux system protein